MDGLAEFFSQLNGCIGGRVKKRSIIRRDK